MENGKRKRKRAEATKGKAGQARRLNTDAKRGKPEREEKRSSGGRYLWAGRGGGVEGQAQAQAWRQPERNPWRTRLFGAALRWRARGRWPPGKATCKAGVASCSHRHTNERTAAKRAELVVSGLVLNWSAAVGRFRVVRGWRLGNAAISLGVSRGRGLVGRRRGPRNF